MKKIILCLMYSLSLHACSNTWNTENGNWSDTSSWGNTSCYPGETAVGDVATFGSFPDNPLTVFLDVSPFSLSGLIFNKPFYASPFYTITEFGINALTLGQSPSITVQSGVHEIDVLVQIQPNQTLNIAVSDIFGNLIFGQGGIISSLAGLPSSLIINGLGTVTVNDANLISGGFTVQSGRYVNSNALPVAVGQKGANTDANDVTFSDGVVVVNTNSGVNSGDVGAVIIGESSVVMNKCIVANTNSGDIVSSGNGAVIGSPSSVTINGTSIFQLNTGSLLPPGGGLGAGIISNDLAINGAVDITSQNSAIIQGDQTIGVVIFSQNNSVVNGGVIRLINDGHLTGTAKFGSLFSTGNTFTMNSGKIICQNSGTIDSTVSSKCLGSVIVADDLFVMNGGTIILENSGDVASNNIGSAIAAFGGNVPKNLIMNGGLIIVGKNSGTIAPGGFGTGIGGAALFLNGGTVINNGNILMSSVSIGPAGTLEGTGVIVDPFQATLTTVDNQGVVSPGDPTGTLTVDGVYAQESNGTLLIHVHSAKKGKWGKLVVSDQVTLSGTLTVKLLPHASIHDGDTIVVLDNSGFTGPIAGRFSKVVTKNFPSDLTAQVIYKTNQVLVKFKIGKINPPTHLKGVQLKRCICQKVEYVNHLTWNKSKTSTVVSYLIERDGKEIATVSAKKPLVYDDANQPHASAEYKVFAVDKSGKKSKPAVVVVEPFIPVCRCSSGPK